jgi:hypothetical protein
MQGQRPAHTHPGTTTRRHTSCTTTRSHTSCTTTRTHTSCTTTRTHASCRQNNPHTHIMQGQQPAHTHIHHAGTTTRAHTSCRDNKPHLGWRPRPAAGPGHPRPWEGRSRQSQTAHHQWRCTGKAKKDTHIHTHTFAQNKRRRGEGGAWMWTVGVMAMCGGREVGGMSSVRASTGRLLVWLSVHMCASPQPMYAPAELWEGGDRLQTNGVL